MIKTYSAGNLNYGYSREFRKWLFSNGSFSLVQTCNGAGTAHKVANIVNGAFKRTKSNAIDGLARSQISRLGV